MSFDTLAAMLPEAARDDRQITFVEGDGDERVLSFRRLRQRALGVLGALQRRGLRAGDHLLVCLGDNERFVEVFWGCVLGAIVPVPLAASGTPEQLRKVVRIAALLQPAAICTDARTLERLQALDAATVARCFVAGSSDGAGAPGRPAAPRADDLAFIQYSSGSTGDPKGVPLTHRNLAANVASIIEAAEFSDRDRALSWMPLSHDMGLIGFHINMLACGASHALMRTDLFTRRPLLWLEQASRSRATVLCSPNFGLRHTLRALDARPPGRLELSAVRLLFNGAEPIAADLCRRFMQALAPHGLPSHSMFPVYGLAEASLAVTFPRPGSALQTMWLGRASLASARPGDAAASEFVKLGWPLPRSEVRIAGADGPGVLGPVQVRGANVMRGYHGAAPADADGWVDTGDLGLLDGDGQLVVTGRAKDVVFVNGQNVYPHDVERVAEQVPGVETNRVAAAAVPAADGQGEELALFVVNRGSIAAFAALAAELRRTMNRQMGLEVAHVVPVKQMPKTSSGKLQRYQLAAAHARGDHAAALAELAPLLSVQGDEAAGRGTLAQLQAICRSVVPGIPLAPETNLMEANLSSLNLARVHEAIERAFPQRIDVSDLFDHPTLDELAIFLDGQADVAP